MKRSQLCIIIFLLIFEGQVFAKTDTKVKVQTLTPNIHMLMGQGGNIGMLSGPDGVILIDDQYPQMSKSLKTMVKKMSQTPIKFVLNTHWHGDHTGGNEAMAKTGAAIVAHENVRKRLSADQVIKAFDKKVKASPKSAWPVVTFTRDISFHLNGEELKVFHVEHAHTDGDVIIHFPKANVIHMGDTFFNGNYPFIDKSSGGSLKGMIAAGERVLLLCDSKTKIIPGHGPLAKKTNLKKYINMLKSIEKSMAPYMNKKLKLEEVLKKAPLKHLEKEWGGGFFKTPDFIKILLN